MYHLHTLRHMSISRFSLRDKVTLRLLKLYFNIADVVEWSRALDIRLSDWCFRRVYILMCLECSDKNTIK